ncbi:uncharacterized protein BDR25DRAFT_360244 [Lindgomyces ingoldianus]|uniref:Uncharacterized protein n=1 Tax=Lindgomyces ingoldianus TaxID=673940 RepID=A0ACB6QFI4_9PLEO|nr:uncharacterized protein BDR25DRAFT_360244 [Lindgomyces ingoldianus]KAF2465723.1 hypothetical protein BDR25DRAFT_360244 [Lindgomyces ingoldianus]
MSDACSSSNAIGPREHPSYADAAPHRAALMEKGEDERGIARRRDSYLIDDQQALEFACIGCYVMHTPRLTLITSPNSYEDVKAVGGALSYFYRTLNVHLGQNAFVNVPRRCKIPMDVLRYLSLILQPKIGKTRVSAQSDDEFRSRAKYKDMNFETGRKDLTMVDWCVLLFSCSPPSSISRILHEDLGLEIYHMSPQSFPTQHNRKNPQPTQARKTPPKKRTGTQSVRQRAAREQTAWDSGKVHLDWLCGLRYTSPKYKESLFFWTGDCGLGYLDFAQSCEKNCACLAHDVYIETHFIIIERLAMPDHTVCCLPYPYHHANAKKKKKKKQGVNYQARFNRSVKAREESICPKSIQEQKTAKTKI